MIKEIIILITENIMGAIAVSKKEEQQIEKLRREVQESVRRCAAADKEENRKLFPGGIARSLPG